MTRDRSSFALSYPQREIWHALGAAGRWRDGEIRLELLIEGTVRTGVLAQALTDVVTRHAALRTVLIEGPEGLHQRVLEPLPVPLRIVKGAPRGHRDDASTSDCGDLGIGENIPFRAWLSEQPAAQWVLVLLTHRIAADRASEALLLRDLSLACAARAAGHAPDWETSAAEYRDYVDWQLKQLGEDAPDRVSASLRARHLRFWRRYFDKMPFQAHARANSSTLPEHASGRLAVELPAWLLRGARALAASGRVTLEMTLKACLAQALCKLHARQEVVVASVHSGRYCREFEGMMGAFDAVLPGRYDDVPARSFAELLRHVSERDIEVFRRPFLPVSLITQQLFAQPPGRIVDALLIVHEEPPLTCELPGATTRLARYAQVVPHIGIVLELDPAPSADDPLMVGQLTYCLSWLNRGAAENLWHAVLNCLEEAIAQMGFIAAGDNPVEWRLNSLLHRNAYLAPHDPLQHQLVPIWEDVLRCFPVGVWDDFYALGGNEFLARQVLARSAKLCGEPARLPSGEGECTIEKLAESVLESTPRLPHILVRRGGIEEGPPLFFLHGDFNGGGLYVKELARGLDACGTIFALPPHGMNGKEVPASIEEMAFDHLATLRSLQPRGPYYLAGYCNGGLVAYEMARELQLAGEEVAFLGVIHAWFNRTKAQVAVMPVAPLPHLAVPPPDSPVWNVKRRQSALRYSSYRLPMWTYHPDTYAGRVNLFWPKEEAFAGEPPQSAWERIAHAVDLDFISGRHLTCITTFVADLAAALNQRLHMAKARSQSAYIQEQAHFHHESEAHPRVG